MPELFSRIRYGRIFRENAAGAAGWFEKTTIAGEQQLKEQRQKERDEQLAKVRGR